MPESSIENTENQQLSGPVEEAGGKEQLAAKQISLRREFPMTHRRSLKKSIWSLMIFLGGLGMALLAERHLVSNMESQSDQEIGRMLLSFFVLGLFAYWFLRFIYFELDRLFYDYRIVGGNLHVSKGILLKEKGSFPLSRITDIYLHRGLGDFFWGLSSLHVSTPTLSSGEFAYIHGLTIKNADRLRKRLETLVKEHDLHIERIGGYVKDLHTENGQRVTAGEDS